MTDRLWAPWRMAFILQSDKPQGCVLCGYAGASPCRESGVLAAREHAFVVLNKYPYAPAHLLIVPGGHVSSLGALSHVEHDALFRLVRDSVAALERAIAPQGVNVGMNLGKVAGAGIEEHLHVHVVPRWQGDNNFMPVIADMRVMPEYLEETWLRLAPEFEKLGAGA